MAKFTWQDGTLVSKAKVEIGGTIYEVDPEEYSGATPLSASNLNNMQDGLFDWIYPVGSYYETSDASFNPNNNWLGTWVLDSEGLVTVSQSNDEEFATVGQTGGSKTNTHDHGKGANLTTSAASSGPYVIGDGNTVTSNTISVLQPYIVVKRWHRVA